MFSILNEIGHNYGTDKCSCHNNFLIRYEDFLEDFRHDFNTVLEIGIKDGSSLRTWSDYFVNSQIFGIDIQIESLMNYGPRVKVGIFDVKDLEKLRDFIGESIFDLIIDDGSHVWSDQIETFSYLFQFVKPGGFYIVEDLDTSFGVLTRDYCGMGGPTAFEYLTELAGFVIGNRGMHHLRPNFDIPFELARDVDTITFSQGFAVIRKTNPTNNLNP